MEPSNDRELLNFVLDRLRHERDELLDAWRQIDGKAQATASIAGVFMAAAFVFVQNSSLKLTRVEQWMLLVVVILLVVSIALATLAMLVKSSALPLTGHAAATMVADILRVNDKERESRHVGLLADAVNIWNPANSHLRDEIRRKSALLRSSQVAVGMAAAAMLFLSSVAILTRNGG